MNKKLGQGTTVIMIMQLGSADPKKEPRCSTSCTVPQRGNHTAIPSWAGPSLATVVLLNENETQGSEINCNKIFIALCSHSQLVITIH